MIRFKTFGTILLGASITQAFAADNVPSSDANTSSKAQPRARRVFDASAFLPPAAKVSGTDASPRTAARDAAVDGVPADTVVVASDASPVRPSRARRAFDASAFLSPAAKVSGTDASPRTAARDAAVEGVLTDAAVVASDASPVRPSKARRAFDASAFLSPSAQAPTASSGLVLAEEEGAADDRSVPPPSTRVMFDASAFLASSAPAFTEMSPSKLGGGKVKSPSRLGARGVYATPLMSRWMDAAEAGTDLVGLTAAEAVEILKYFASYLDKVKRTTSDVDDVKGPYTGNWGSRTYLSEVTAMQAKLLAHPADAKVLAEAIKFINKRKSSFFKSLISQKMVD